MTSLMQELRNRGVSPKKSLGQHFLIDKGVAQKIVRLASLKPEDCVIEIGPGMGVLTFLMLPLVKRVVAVEVDQEMADYLRERGGGMPSLTVMCRDALHFDFQGLAHETGKKLTIVANLPYNISTPVIFRLLESRETVAHLTLMLQHEVAQRITASPDSKAYGPLSIFTQLYTSPKLMMRVPPQAFYPPPKVESALVGFEILQHPRVEVRDTEFFHEVVRASFAQRRKTICNSLKNSLVTLGSKEKIKEILKAVGIDPRRRAETLDLTEFKDLAEALKSFKEVSNPILASGPRKLMKDTVKNGCLAIFRAGLEAVDPYKATKRALRFSGEEFQVGEHSYHLKDFTRIVVVGAGKAGAPMAQAVEEVLGERLEGGLIVVKYGYTAALKKVKIIEGGHPIPDEAGQLGARELLEIVKGLGEDDLAICLISGGGSALLPAPVEGVGLAEKQETTKLLLESGASIHEINAIRKHLSRIKGGGLANAATPATMITLILSDVIGDDLDVIASGPTVGDRSTFADCLRMIEKYELNAQIPSVVMEHLHKGAEGKAQETPKPDDPVFRKGFNLIVGSNMQCLEAAARKAQAIGYQTLILSSLIEGETREVAKVHGAILKEIIRTGKPLAPPACIISGGETTVTIRGKGKGGRNQEFALACGMEIAGWVGATVFSAGTDGTDGPTDAAGAFADWRMVERARQMGLDPGAFLRENDAYTFFEKLGDLIITGPTNTNVMDVRILIAV